MSRQWVGPLLTGLVVVPVVMLVAVPVGYFVFMYGCGEAEDRLTEAIAGDPVLDARPAGAAKEQPYDGCDDDDLFVYAGTDYSYHAPRQSVLGHYEETARANGWRPRATSEDGAAADCFVKRIDGTTAYLTVDGPDNGKVHVSITADRAGSEWC
ncbi:hypothetical protein ACFRR7_32955 [Streptomyces sp. NPDC056909]|uniref:hypothetical protein n=1 Tax=Streptomyces sp. NPDC056909 TaxID=3345963 RepID=UPI0036D01251